MASLRWYSETSGLRPNLMPADCARFQRQASRKRAEISAQRPEVGDRLTREMAAKAPFVLAVLNIWVARRRRISQLIDREAGCIWQDANLGAPAHGRDDIQKTAFPVCRVGPCWARRSPFRRSRSAGSHQSRACNTNDSPNQVVQNKLPDNARVPRGQSKITPRPCVGLVHPSLLQQLESLAADR
jgi:hypothetical protein